MSAIPVYEKDNSKLRSSDSRLAPREFSKEAATLNWSAAYATVTPSTARPAPSTLPTLAEEVLYARL